MDDSLVVEGLNIAELGDEELMQRLQNLGFNPGPILATTRSVYQRKLARMLRNEDFEDDERPPGEGGEGLSQAPDLNATFQSYTSTPLSSFNSDDLRRRPLSRVGGENWAEGPPILSPHKPWSIDDIVTRAPPPPAEPEKPFISITAKAFVVVTLLLLAFFVYYNMESTPADPFISNV